MKANNTLRSTVQSKSILSLVAINTLFAACSVETHLDSQPSLDTSTVNSDTVRLEPVFVDSTYQLTGVAVSADGRLFVNYPYWLDEHAYSVIEVDENGKPQPYPDANWNSFRKGEDGAQKFVCVQAVYTDDQGFLWIVDAAGIGLGEVYQESNKVIKVNLQTNQVERIYRFPASVAGKDSYLNDIRVDNQRGFAYLTSSSNGGIVVFNLETGDSRFVLHSHPSTLSDTTYHFTMNGSELSNTQGTVRINSDGIALSPDHQWLYYKPLTDDKLYRVSTDVLRDFSSSEQQIAEKVEDLGRFTTTDGMIFDTKGNLYMGDLESSRIIKITPDHQSIMLAEDPDLLSWPDSYSISADGYLYISCSQIQQMPWFNGGQNQTRLPYQIVRLKI